MNDINTLLRLRRELGKVMNREDGICDSESLNTKNNAQAMEIKIYLNEAMLKINLALLKAGS